MRVYRWLGIRIALVIRHWTFNVIVVSLNLIKSKIMYSSASFLWCLVFEITYVVGPREKKNFGLF